MQSAAKPLRPVSLSSAIVGQISPVPSAALSSFQAQSRVAARCFIDEVGTIEDCQTSMKLPNFLSALRSTPKQHESKGDARLSDSSGKDKDSPFHYEAGRPIFDGEAEREQARIAARDRKEDEYKDRQLGIAAEQLSLARQALYTQIGLVIFGIVGVGVSISQARSSWKAFGATVQQFRIENRAYLSVGAVESPMKWNLLKVSINNIGHVSAKHLSLSFDFRRFDTQPIGTAQRVDGIDHRVMDLQQADTIDPGVGTYTLLITTPYPSMEENQKMLTGQESITVEVHLKYDVGFGDTDTLPSCFMFNQLHGAWTDCGKQGAMIDLTRSYDLGSYSVSGEDQ